MRSVNEELSIPTRRSDDRNLENSKLVRSMGAGDLERTDPPHRLQSRSADLLTGPSRSEQFDRRQISSSNGALAANKGATPS